MEIIPAIDIRGGRCVRLEQGDYAREMVFSDDPVAVGRAWESQGATRLHVVDLDGARTGAPVNDAIIGRLIASVSLPVQVGGGIRTAQVVERYLKDLRADRVVLGTAAVRDPGRIAALCRRWGERMVIAVDARDGIVAVEGWTESSGIPAETLMDRLIAVGVRRFLYTDISRDGTLSEPNFAAVERLARRLPVPLIASGGVASVEHLRRLAKTGVEAVIVGRALYTGAVDLRQALGVSR